MNDTTAGMTPVAPQAARRRAAPAERWSKDVELAARRRSPTARSSCSTRCRRRRSPARRSATRTPTSSTSRPTCEGARGGVRRGEAAPAPEKNPQLADADRHRFAAVYAALAPYRRGTDVRALHRAHRRPTRKTLSQAIDALAEPLSKVAKPGRRRERPDRSGRVSRRRFLGDGRGSPGAGASASAAATAVVLGRRDDRRGPDAGGHGAVLRRAPGRDRHAGAGPAAVRRVRRDHRRQRPSCVDLLQRVDDGARRR